MTDDNTSYIAQAVANGPMTLAQPSFGGHGWLVVVNLAIMTAGFVIALSIASSMIADVVRWRKQDQRQHPVTIWRVIGFCLGAGMTLRFGAEAACLWGWNPLDPVGTGWLMTLKRYIDPVAAAFGLAAMVLFRLSGQGMADQLRKRPFPIHLWASREQLRKPAQIVILSVIAAIGVVSTR